MLISTQIYHQLKLQGNKMRILAVFATLLLSFPTLADSINLGQAEKYGAFIKNDYTVSSSDVQGRVAVGGDFNVTLNQWGGGGGYEVGNKIIDFSMGDGPSLIVGGDINKAGNGEFNIYQTATLPNPVMGDVVLGGVIQGNVGQVAYASASEQADISPYVDFESAFTHLENLSLQLSQRTVASEVVITNSTLAFDVDPNVVPEDGVYVFNVTEQMFKNSSGGTRTDWIIDSSNMADDATVVFNVTNENGTSVTLPQANIFLDDTSNPLSSYSDKDLGTNAAVQVLYNFYGASQLNLSSDLYGSVLAPSADIKAIDSVIYGQVIGKSWEGNMQINYNPFDPVGTPTPVPEPSTFIIFALAFVLMLTRNKLPKIKFNNQITCLA